MKVVYMCHPVRGDVAENLRRAKEWVRKLEERHPDVAVVATWIVECEVFDDADEEQREAGLRRDMAVIERCDELWLVGERISEGMRREAMHAEACGIPVQWVTETSSVRMGPGVVEKIA